MISLASTPQLLILVIVEPLSKNNDAKQTQMKLVKEERKLIATLVSKAKLVDFLRFKKVDPTESILDKAEVVEYVVLIQRVYEDSAKNNARICKSHMTKKRLLRIPKASVGIVANGMAQMSVDSPSDMSSSSN